MSGYCAYGFLQKDYKGKVLEISFNELKEATAKIETQSGNIEYWDKNFVIIFSSEQERDIWMKEQDFQYDNRS